MEICIKHVYIFALEGMDLNVIIHLVNRGLKIGTAVVKDAQGNPSNYQ